MKTVLYNLLWKVGNRFPVVHPFASVTTPAESSTSQFNLAARPYLCVCAREKSTIRTESLVLSRASAEADENANVASSQKMHQPWILFKQMQSNKNICKTATNFGNLIFKYTKYACISIFKR